MAVLSAFRSWLPGGGVPCHLLDSYGGSVCKFCSPFFHQNDEKMIICGHGAASENSRGRSHSEHLAQRAGGMGSE